MISIRFLRAAVCAAAGAAALSCTFDYGTTVVESDNFPEITMENIEYVRVRDGQLQARLKAETAERFEGRHLMTLKNYTFEEYDTTTSEVEATGKGGAASVEVSSNNVHMSEGVSISVDTEDFGMEAVNLDWDDKAHVLRGAPGAPVQVSRGDGTEVNGTDFHADVRGRNWVFGSDVHGSYQTESEGESGENILTAGSPAAEPPAQAAP